MHLYIRVVNWEKAQHDIVTKKGGRPRGDGTEARRSTPEFFSVYVSLWQERQFDRLPDREKLALFTIWMLTAVHGNDKVEADAEWIRRKGCIQGDIHLGELVDAGFIVLVDADGRPVDELPDECWGSPIRMVEAAERLAAPTPSTPERMNRLVRDVEILNGAPSQDLAPEGVLKTSDAGLENLATRNPEVAEQSRREETKIDIRSNPVEPVAFVSADGDDLQIIVQDLPDDVRAEMLRLANALPRGKESIGRMVNLARAGATARMFADARQAYQVSTTRKPNPGAWACEIIEEHLRGAA